MIVLAVKQSHSTSSCNGLASCNFIQVVVRIVSVAFAKASYGTHCKLGKEWSPYLTV